MNQTRSNLKLGLTLFVLALVALAAGYGLRTLTLGDSGATPSGHTETIIGQTRPEFSLPDLAGKTHAIKDWDGKVLLVNFWATWCPPCQKEIPGFITVREQLGPQGFEVIGVAIDTPEAISDFVDTLDIPYPILHGERDASKISLEYGNRLGGLPYSVLVDREGIIRSVVTGEFRAADLREQLKPLL